MLSTFHQQYNIVRDDLGRFRRGERILHLQDRRGNWVDVLVDLREDSILYTVKSWNGKTSNVPQQVIGATREQCLQTCSGCLLLDEKTCYSQFGISAVGFSGTMRSYKKGIDKSLEFALKHLHKDANILRMGAIGDPGSIAPDVYLKHDYMIRRADLEPLSYTHQWHWDHASFLKGLALSSCDTFQEVVDSLNSGWRATLHLDKDAKAFNGKSILEAPQGKVKGVRYFFCPAQREKFLGRRPVTCNDCRLCDGKKKTNVDLIVFAEHGRMMQFKKMREARNQVSLQWESHKNESVLQSTNLL